MGKIRPLMLLPPLLFLGLAVLFYVGNFREGRNDLPSARAGQEAPALGVQQLGERVLFTDAMLREGEVTLVNFWATWCTPCVAEIPEFNKIPTQFNHRPVKVILVSLDFQGQKEKRIIPFIKANKISHTVVHLITPRGGDWINAIDPSWSGAIPATLLVYQQSKRTFFEGQLDYPGIVSLMENTLK